jgi:hypothetical protein
VIGLLAAALVLASLHVRRPATFCVLRAATGVPCPLCGGTTAGVALGQGDLLASFRASPLVVLGGAVFVAAPRLPRPVLSPRQLWTVIAVVAVAAEVWQLFRFGTV